MIESQRWLGIKKGGVLKGHGIIKGDLFNQGTLALHVDKPLQVQGSGAGATLLGDRQPPKQQGKPRVTLKCRHCGTDSHSFGQADKCKRHLEALCKDPFCSICSSKAHTSYDCPNHSRFKNKKTTLLGLPRGQAGVSLASLADDALKGLAEEGLARLVS